MIRESAQEVAQGLQDRPQLLRDLKLVFALHLNSSALERVSIAFGLINDDDNNNNNSNKA